MIDMDFRLARLREMSPDPRLESIDAIVFDELAARRSRRHALRGSVVGLAACGSLVAGVMGAAFPAAPVRVDDPLSLGAPSALSPSTLLSTAG